MKLKIDDIDERIYFISDDESVNGKDKITLIRKKYIVDMESVLCNCGVQYSVAANSLMWYCPVCHSLFMKEYSEIPKKFCNTIAFIEKVSNFCYNE